MMSNFYYFLCRLMPKRGGLGIRMSAWRMTSSLYWSNVRLIRNGSLPLYFLLASMTEITRQLNFKTFSHLICPIHQSHPSSIAPAPEGRKNPSQNPFKTRSENCKNIKERLFQRARNPRSINAIIRTLAQESHQNLRATKESKML